MLATLHLNTVGNLDYTCVFICSSWMIDIIRSGVYTKSLQYLSCQIKQSYINNQLYPCIHWGDHEFGQRLSPACSQCLSDFRGVRANIGWTTAQSQEGRPSP
ncbi:hypothetical protein PDJAM_G00007230 [Pangasius djambal]|uniref:Uncharacterized protein n=1 Tax=Pangasius djambal TaxID=1691987 RepID=A0ACC5Y0Y3_9TELE|nr:hypothetical protein [Pangasius djambal]